MVQETESSQGIILSYVIEKSRLIHQQQSKADRGEFDNMGPALGLQHLREERMFFQKKLNKPTLVSFEPSIPVYGSAERPKRPWRDALNA